jgi:hypothetical protein
LLKRERSPSILLLKNFETDAKITGSVNQEKLEEYKKMMRRFNDRNLELIQQNFEAQRDENEELLLATNHEYDRLLKTQVPLHGKFCNKQ